MPSTGAIESFWFVVDRVFGAYHDAMAGFHFLLDQIGHSQIIIASQLKVTLEHLDTVPFDYGIGDPDDPKHVIQHRVSQGELKRRNSKDGGNPLFMGSMCLVAIYQFWEDKFRGEIAKELGTSKELLLSDVMGDVRLIRIAIIHHGGVARQQIERCKTFKWFEAGSAIDIDNERMTAIVFAIRGECLRWIAEREHSALS
jgi:hypothetical protein